MARLNELQAKVDALNIPDLTPVNAKVSALISWQAGVDTGVAALKARPAGKDFTADTAAAKQALLAVADALDVRLVALARASHNTVDLHGLDARVEDIRVAQDMVIESAHVVPEELRTRMAAIEERVGKLETDPIVGRPFRFQMGRLQIEGEFK